MSKKCNSQKKCKCQCRTCFPVAPTRQAAGAAAVPQVSAQVSGSTVSVSGSTSGSAGGSAVGAVNGVKTWVAGVGFF